MELTFPPSWFAAGLVTAESAADFARYVVSEPTRPRRHWLWLAFRDYVEENTPLSAEVCRAIYRLGEAEADANLGTAMMCSAIYQRNCPADVLDGAYSSVRGAVKRALLASRAA